MESDTFYGNFMVKLIKRLRVTFCKTDTPEIHDPFRFALFLAQVCIMTRNACPQNYSFLAYLLSKLQHLKKCFQLLAKFRFLRSAYF